MTDKHWIAGTLYCLEQSLSPMPREVHGLARKAPLPEQHRIVARVQQLRALCAQLRERLQQARRTQGLLADALANTAVNA